MTQNIALAQKTNESMSELSLSESCLKDFSKLSLNFPKTSSNLSQDILKAIKKISQFFQNICKTFSKNV